jgi:hypothetical protein
MLKKFHLFLWGVCVLCLQAQSQTINNVNTNAKLIQAILDCNADPADGVINIVPGTIFTLNNAYITNAEGEGAVALPIILRKGQLGNSPYRERPWGGKLTINGNGAIIERGNVLNKFRLLFAQDRSEVELNQLTIQNGNTADTGAGMYCAARTTATFNNCKFLNNVSTVVQIQGGGAVAIRSFCTTTFNNCEFRNNLTTRSNGGAIANVLSTLTINNCRFLNNKSTSTIIGDNNVGGGVYIDGSGTDSGLIRLTNSLFDGNESNIGAGFSCFMYNTQKVIVEGCTFRNNKAVGDDGIGGGFRMLSATITNTDLTAPAEANTELAMKNCVFHDNSATFQGGGVMLGQGGGICTLTNCTIVNNRAAQSNGKGGSGGGLFSNDMEVILKHCTIARNYAGTLGGGIGNGTDPFDITLYNCILAYNISHDNGSGKKRRMNCRNVYKGNGNIEFPAPNLADALDGRCTQTVPLHIDPKLGQLSNNGGITATVPLLVGSPAIDASFGNETQYAPTDQRGVLPENIPGVGDNGTKIRDIGAYEFSLLPPPIEVGVANLVAVTQASSQTQINLTWADKATGEYEFEIQRSENNIFNFSTIATVLSEVTTYQSKLLESNEVYYYRVRAVYADSTSGWSNIAGAVTNTNGACDSLLYQPTAIPIPNTVVGNGTPESCTQQALQTALNTGGLIMCNCGSAPTAIVLTATLNVTVNNTVLDGGTFVTLSGGNALRVLRVNKGINFTLQNIRIINGKAPATGGLFNESGGGMLVGDGITSNNAMIKVINTAFENNTTTNISTSERGGGAIYTHSLKNLIISGTSFKNNSANVGGAIGGIGSQLTIINSNFQDNQAIGDGTARNGVGGAVYTDGIDLWDEALTEEHIFTICGSTFNKNRANHQGGAVYSAVSDGKRNKVVIDKSSFEYNRLINGSKGNGGAIFHIEDDYAGANPPNEPLLNLSITNSTFAYNTCKVEGGAIWTLVAGNVDILNTTFHANSVTKTSTALGGAIAIASAGYGGTYNIRNTTFANNTSANFAGAVFASELNKVNINTCIFSENTSVIDFEGQQLDGNATFTGTKNMLYPLLRGNGTPDEFPVVAVSNDNPLLQPLTFNGGFTETMALASNSPAVNQGTNNQLKDQRSLNKVNTRDIGAFEFGAVLPKNPIIVSFTPLSASLGATITLQGSGFTGANQVTFNGVPATAFTVISATEISVVVPRLATSGKISVTNSTDLGFSIEDFIVNIPAPSVTSFTPKSGGRGTLITLSGAGLLSTTSVSIGGINAPVYTVTSNSKVTVTVPDNALTGIVSILTNGGAANTQGLTIDKFTVTPSVNGFTPTLGKAGDNIVIQGTNLAGVTAVKFNGINATNFTVNSPTQITAKVPTTTTGKVSITIGSNTYLSTSNYVIVAPPKITSFAPTTGTPGTLVTVKGSNFTQVLELDFTGSPIGTVVPANSVHIIDDNTIEVIVPVSATNGAIKVISPGGQATSVGTFLVLPAISHFTPLTGGQGTLVKMIGTNFVEAGITKVFIGGVEATFEPDYFDPQGIQIRFRVGAGATGKITFQSDNGTAISPKVFTFTTTTTAQARANKQDTEEAPATMTNGFTVIPNPNTGNFTIKLPTEKYGVYNIKIYNQLGKVVFQKEVQSTNLEPDIELSAPALPAGNYQVSVVGADFSKMIRFVKY